MYKVHKYMEVQKMHKKHKGLVKLGKFRQGLINF